MRVYLASSYSRREEMLRYAAELRAIGVEVVSSWIDGHHETPLNSDREHTRMAAARWAREDLLDIDRADLLILFTQPEGQYRRGGCLVEYGYALGKGVGVTVIGPERQRTNVFFAEETVGRFDSWAALMQVWREEVRAFGGLP